MEQLSLSVVIPTHDTCELVLRCLESLGDGGVEPAEVVVVDDASADGTAEAVRDRHPAARVVSTVDNLGFGGAANLGAERATGDVILVLNSDTEVLEGGLAALVAAFADDAALGIAGAELLDPDGTPQWRAGCWPTRRWLFAQASGLGSVLGRRRGRGSERVGRVDWVSGAAMAIRRDVWTSCGPFDAGYAFYCQDLDLCWSASRAGHGVAVAPGFRVLHHHGATIGSSAGAAASFHPARLWADLVRFTAKHHGSGQARSAASALRAGVRLRLLSRALAAPFASDKASWQRDSDAFRKGLEALR